MRNDTEYSRSEIIKKNVLIKLFNWNNNTPIDFSGICIRAQAASMRLEK